MTLIKKYIKKKMGKSIEPEKETRGLEMLLLDAVKNKGCPICSSTASHDKWELDETMRKMAWDTRPEPKGSEQSAWHRGFARFSGLPPDTCQHVK